MSSTIASGTRSPRATYSWTERPIAEPDSMWLRSRSPLEMWVSRKRLATSVACVPLPEPGAPMSNTRIGRPFDVLPGRPASRRRYAT